MTDIQFQSLVTMVGSVVTTAGVVAVAWIQYLQGRKVEDLKGAVIQNRTDSKEAAVVATAAVKEATQVASEAAKLGETIHTLVNNNLAKVEEAKRATEIALAEARAQNNQLLSLMASKGIAPAIPTVQPALPQTIPITLTAPADPIPVKLVPPDDPGGKSTKEEGAK